MTVHLPILSASQLATAHLCKRKWAYDKIDRIPRKPNASAELGTRVHAVLEDWFLRHKPIDLTTREGQIAAPALRYLPPAGLPGLSTEGQFTLRLVHHFTGFIDLRLGVAIFDHKTTKNYHYAKTPEQLEHDPQALLYAWAIMVETGAQQVFLQWTYLDTAAEKEPHVVKKSLDRATVLQHIQSHLALADELVWYRANTTQANHVPKDPNGCDAFGGCPYHSSRGGPCDVTPGESLRARLAQAEFLNGER